LAESVRKIINIRFTVSSRGGEQVARVNQKLANSFEKARKAEWRFRVMTAGTRRIIGAIRNEILILVFAFGEFVRQLGNTVKAANLMQSAFTGLASVARNVGASVSQAQNAARELADTGLLSVTEAAAALKNLLATGIGLDKATEVMWAFTDAAAFNRQGTLSLGEAVVGATEGFKNMLCLSGDTKVLNMVDGKWYTLKELHDDKEETPAVLSVDRDSKELKVIQSTYLHYNGIRHVWEVELENGAKIKATKNHRFLTQDGFKFLKDIDEEHDILYFVDENKIFQEIEEDIDWKRKSVNIVGDFSETKGLKLKKEDSVVESVDMHGSKNIRLVKSLAKKLNLNVEIAERCLKELEALSEEEMENIALENVNMNGTEEDTLAKIALVLLEELGSRVSGVKKSIKSHHMLQKRRDFVRKNVEKNGSLGECLVIDTQIGREGLLEEETNYQLIKNIKSSEKEFLPEMPFDVFDAKVMLEEIFRWIHSNVKSSFEEKIENYPYAHEDTKNFLCRYGRSV